MMKFQIRWLGIDSTFKEVGIYHKNTEHAEMLKRVTSMKNELVASTPIDTGYARSRWQIFGGNIGMYSVENDADYIDELNRGHSKQAGPYFIERVALRYGIPVGAIVLQR
jgi:hypothetical protein